MSFVAFLVSLVVSGLVIGGLGRLAVPGPDPMSLGLTFAIGIGGSLAGGLVAALLGGGLFLSLVLEVAAAAGLVVLVSRRGGRRALR